MAIRKLRFMTYLSPSIPESFYREIVGRVGSLLNIETTLQLDSTASGPTSVGRDPLTRGEIDVAFLCAPAYLWLRDLKPSPIALVAAAPVPADERCEGAPVFFSEVIVEKDAGLESFDDLEGCLFAYNDTQSLGGYYAMLRTLEDENRSEHFFSSMVMTGSHLGSIEQVRTGEADAACIDSQVLSTILAENPGLADEIQVIRSLGPLPIQPLVMRSALPTELHEALANALCNLHKEVPGKRLLEKHGYSRFVAPDEALYSRDRLLAHYGP
jgi:phosphonate transport system substrate-binding protein